MKKYILVSFCCNNSEFSNAIFDKKEDAEKAMNDEYTSYEEDIVYSGISHSSAYIVFVDGEIDWEIIEVDFNK